MMNLFSVTAKILVGYLLRLCFFLRSIACVAFISFLNSFAQIINSYTENGAQKTAFLKKILISVFLLFLFPTFHVFGQTSIPYSSSGTYYWTCPAGVTSVTAECWGGGGAGGGVTNNGYPNGVGGAGGAGGAYSSKTITVTPGNIYTVTVGKGGNGGTGNGPKGGDSWFNTSGTVVAIGGNGGKSNNGSPGIGTTTGSIGSPVYQGGDGASGSSAYGAAGGGAGSMGNGGNGTISSPYIAGGAGASIGGGNGGDAITNDGKGNSGNSAGGGGSGAYTGTNSNYSGGNGADGQVVLTYYTAPTITSFTPSSGCANTTSVVITGTNFTGATAVKFGGTDASSYTVNSSTQITATPASGSTGVISVATSSGTATSSSSFTVNSAPSATISYSGTPFCKSVGTAQSVTRSGTSGGTYSASPAGLSIAANGAITPSASTAGTYTVTYTMAATGGCSAQTATASVIITTLPSATISYSGTPFCKSLSTAQSVTFSGTSGGTYSASPAGLSMAANGAITPSTSTAGTYTVTYTMAATGGCSAQTATAAVIITPIPSATISYSGTPYCSSGGTASVSLTGTPGGTFTPDLGLIINGSTGSVNLSGSTAGNHTVTYSIAASGGCSSFSTTTNITITTQPYAQGFYPANPYCSNIGTLYPTGTQQGLMGTLSSSPSGLSINSTNAIINVSSSTPGSYTVFYNVPASGGCAAYSASAPLVISTAPSASINYSGSPYCPGAGSAYASKTGTTGGSFSSTTGLVINSSTGTVNLSTSTPGTYTVTYTILAANGCAQYTTTANIIITSKVSSLVFAAGSSSTRCQGGGTVTYSATASNTTGITYSLDATNLTAGNTINSSTGAVTFAATWSGTSTITALAAGCTPLTTTHVAVTSATPSVSAATTLTCVGGSTGSITATGSLGSSPYMYNLNNGGYQSGNLFTGLSISNYTLYVKSNDGCIGSTSVTVSTYPTSADDQSASATNSWIGHTYSGNNFQNYIGHFTEPEAFDESFGGSTTCFGLISGATYPSIYTENFSVRFRMNSTRKGLYVVDLGSDDGSRLYVDGTLIYNNWTPQSFVTRPGVLMSLSGNNSLTYEFFENGGGNRVIFNNLTLVLANSLSTNTTQSICFGNSGNTISGDVYGSLPSGISTSGAGYQWTYSSTPGGTATNIAGATGATFTPNTSTAPFSIPGTYYVYRNAILSSGNNVGESPYTATNVSNVATITVNPIPSATISYANAPFCNTSSLPETVTLTGTTGGVFSASGLTINSSTGDIVPGSNPVGLYTINYSVAAGGCAAFATSTKIYIGTPGTWSGKVNTEWTNAGNWICGMIPSSTTDATIPKMVSNFPTVISNSAEAKNLNIRGGATLIITGAIKIAGAINNAGNFNVSNGTIEMSGSSAQSIAGSMFDNKTIKNLIVSNTGSGLSVSSTASDTLKITGLLSFGNSGSIFNTGNNITLVSNSNGTANVGIVGSSNAINGQVVVERFINTGTAAGQHGKSWQFLSTPTDGQTVKESWMEGGNTLQNYGTMITSPSGVASGFDNSSPAPSMKYYNHVTNSYVGISNTNIPIINPLGYLVFVRGDRSVTATNQPATTTILRTKGTLFTGSLPSINVSPNHYQSVGNPYAASIDFALINKDAHVDDQFYVWDPYLYGTYGVGGYQTISSANGWVPVPGGTSAYPSGVSNSVIQSGQAFFVHSTVAGPILTPTPTLSFAENCKSVSSPSVNVSRVAQNLSVNNNNYLRVSLFTGPGENDMIADGNSVVFNKTFSDEVDGHDALKILNSGENFGVKRAGKILAIEAKAPLTAADTIFYNMSNLAKHTYQLRFAPQNMESIGLQAFLIDGFLKTETSVSLSDSSFVDISITSDKASAAADRFEVVFRQMSALPVTLTSITATAKNSENIIEWNVANESGIQQYEVEKSIDGNHFTQMSVVKSNNSGTGNYNSTDVNVAAGNNFYRVKIISADGKANYSPIVKVINGKITGSISVYPNPIKNGTIHLQLNNQLLGIYQIKLYNSIGQVLISKNITHTEGSSNESIHCDNLAKGIYQLEIHGPNNNEKVIKVLN